jgi:serine/threonine protein kinase
MFLTFQTPSNLFMCLEYMVGGELFSHLRKEGRFAPDVAKFYAASIVLALEFLHDKDIIYRDLKPEVPLIILPANENLLLDHDGYIKIIDFGFSKRCPDRTWTVCGTPEYLAPEIIRSDGHGKAVDWWALGILTYEMLVGYPPYYDSYPLGIYEKILAGNLTFPAYIDPIAKDLIRQLLRPDLSSRLGNLRGGAQDVKEHLWFRYSDWDSLLRKRFVAPFVPRARWAGDAQYFERYDELSGEEVENLMSESEGIGEDFGDLFDGF